MLVTYLLEMTTFFSQHIGRKKILGSYAWKEIFIKSNIYNIIFVSNCKALTQVNCSTKAKTVVKLFENYAYAQAGPIMNEIFEPVIKGIDNESGDWKKGGKYNTKPGKWWEEMADIKNAMRLTRPKEKRMLSHIRKDPYTNEDFCKALKWIEKNTKELQDKGRTGNEKLHEDVLKALKAFMSKMEELEISSTGND